MAEFYTPVLIRPEEQHLSDYGAGAGWLPEQVERARELLRHVRVTGTDPLLPTLAAVADYLEGQGFALGEYSRLMSLDALINQATWIGPLAEFLEEHRPGRLLLEHQMIRARE